MDLDTTENYFRAIEILTAQELLRSITASSYPHMKANEQKKLHRKLHKQGFPDTYAKTLTPDQVAQLLKAGRI